MNMERSSLKGSGQAADRTEEQLKSPEDTGPSPSHVFVNSDSAKMGRWAVHEKKSSVAKEDCSIMAGGSCIGKKSDDRPRDTSCEYCGHSFCLGSSFVFLT